MVLLPQDTWTQRAREEEINRWRIRDHNHPSGLYGKVVKDVEELRAVLDRSISTEDYVRYSKIMEEQNPKPGFVTFERVPYAQSGNGVLREAYKCLSCRQIMIGMPLIFCGEFKEDRKDREVRFYNCYQCGVTMVSERI